MGATTEEKRGMNVRETGDQLWSYYHVRLKSRKFYKYMFRFLFDVVVTNSYILSRYGITTNPRPISKQSLKNFRLKLASQLIGSYCSRVRVGRRRLHSLPLPPSTGESSQQRALLNHLPCKAKSTRCLYCCKIRRPTQRRKTVWYCPGCEGQPPWQSSCPSTLWQWCSLFGKKGIALSQGVPLWDQQENLCMYWGWFHRHTPFAGGEKKTG